MNRRSVAVAVACIALGACSTAEPVPDAAPSAVTVRDVAFEPLHLTVGVGSSVTWSNEDHFDHTVTAGTPEEPHPGEFDGELGKGGTFERTFEAAGAFTYFCRIHPENMQGTVTVG